MRWHLYDSHSTGDGSKDLSHCILANLQPLHPTAHILPPWRLVSLQDQRLYLALQLLLALLQLGYHFVLLTAALPLLTKLMG